jgi:hypothetical protein
MRNSQLPQVDDVAPGDPSKIDPIVQYQSLIPLMLHCQKRPQIAAPPLASAIS